MPHRSGTPLLWSARQSAPYGTRNSALASTGFI
nr:MAG TPA: hypothetical protein [Caudoviricetes sp.]